MKRLGPGMPRLAAGRLALFSLLFIALLPLFFSQPVGAIVRKRKNLLSLKLWSDKQKGKSRVVMRLNEGGYHETEDDQKNHRILVRLYGFRNFGVRPVKVLDDPIIKGVDIKAGEQYLEIAVYLRISHYRYEVSLFEKPAMCVLNIYATRKDELNAPPPVPQPEIAAPYPHTPPAGPDSRESASETALGKKPARRSGPEEKPVGGTGNRESSPAAPPGTVHPGGHPLPPATVNTATAKKPAAVAAPPPAGFGETGKKPVAVSPPQPAEKRAAGASLSPAAPGRELFDQGLKAYQQGDFAAAAAKFAQLVAQYPDSPLAVPARFRRLDARARELFLLGGSRRGVIKVIEEFLAAARRWSEYPDAPWAFFQVAHLYEKIEFYYEAAGVYRALLKRYPTSTFAPAANFALARLEFRLKRYRKAYDEFSRLLEKYPQRGFSAYAHFYRANALYYLGRLKDALQEYRQGIELDAEFLRHDPLSLYLLGCTYHQLKRYPEAKEYFLMMRNLFPDNRYTNRALAKTGEILVTEKQPEKAMLMFRTVIQEFPGSEGDIVARLKMAILGEDEALRRRLTRINVLYAPLLDSEKAYRYLIAKHPDSPFTDIARLHLGRLLQREKRYPESREVLEEMLARRLEPGLRDAAFTALRETIYAEIETAYRKGDYRGIVVLQNRYRDDFLSRPTGIYPFLWIGEALAHCRLSEAALKVFQTLEPLAAHRKKAVKAYYRIACGIAEALADLKRWPALEKFLSGVTSERWPPSWRNRILLVKVRLLAARGRVRAALRRLAVLEETGDLSVAERVAFAALRAELHQRKGAPLSARLALETAVNLAFAHPDKIPGERRFLLGCRLAIAYYQDRKFRAALDLFAKLSLLAPADELPELLFWQLRCCLKLQQPEPGRKLLERLRQDFPENPWTISADNLMKEYQWRQEKLE